MSDHAAGHLKDAIHTLLHKELSDIVCCLH
jgi:hypothetical protein